MPNTAQAKKRLRQDAERTARNKAVKSRMRTEIKKFFQACKENNLRQAQSQIKLATKLLDKAAKNNLLHANNAARKKSKMARTLYELEHRHDDDAKKKKKAKKAES